MKVSLIGIGPGAEDVMTIEAKTAIESADIIFGAKRMLKGFENKKTYPYFLPADILPILTKELPEKACVLFSGDSGFYSGAARMKKALLTWREEKNFDVEVGLLPGISSISYLSSRIGIPYTEGNLLSLHGKKQDPHTVGALMETVKAHEATFVLLSGDEDVRCIGEQLLKTEGLASSDLQIYLGSDLSYDEEEILTLTPEEAAAFHKPGLYVACIANARPVLKELLPLHNDEDYIRDKVPMTKEVIRHESIIALKLKEGDVVFDVGSGTGSVAIEIAGLSPTLSVYSFEKKEEAIALQKKNIEKFHCFNISLAEGDAAENVDKCETPDAVFIGGSGGLLTDIIAKIPSKQNQRFVITAVSLETMAELSKLEKTLDISNFEIRQISVSKARSLGEYHLMQAENPIFICSFCRN